MRKADGVGPCLVTILVNLIVLIGMFVVVPLGLRLIAGPALVWLRPLWFAGAAAGGLSLWLDRGGFAIVLAVVYAAATFVLAAQAPMRLVRHRSLAPREVAVLTALATPAVAGVALVAERAGYELFGFDLEILALTVPHFHYAGFAAALVAGLVCRSADDGPLARAAALSVPAGTVLVLGGYFISDIAELAGAIVLTAGMWMVGWLTWRELRPAAPDRLTRYLFGTSAAVLVVTMLLALEYALGEAVGVPHLSNTWMAATHGLANALGFAVCGLAAWRRVEAAPL